MKTFKNKTTLINSPAIGLILIIIVLVIAVVSVRSFDSFNSPDNAPYPQSKIIKAVQFQDISSIQKLAEGSDNWPISWAADNYLYTSYGDGWGFKPHTDIKLSLGLARIQGIPPDIKGENIRSKTGESIGDGKSGLKASGLLMLNGTLYMLIRNIDRKGNFSRLMWSFDKGKTWSLGFQLYKDFGCPTFLNYGKDYRNSKDGYVYIYSQRGNSAYESYDAIVLARVKVNQLQDETAYQYFGGLEKNLSPIWTKSPNKIEPIFTFPNNCARMEVIYNFGLGRYLLALSYNGESGWGLYEARSPWGPWNTVYHTAKWDVPKVHGFRIPTKWISQDGTTLYLVFSGSNEYGYDAFCVRKAILRLRN